MCIEKQEYIQLLILSHSWVYNFIERGLETKGIARYHVGNGDQTASTATH